MKMDGGQVLCLVLCGCILLYALVGAHQNWWQE